MKIKPLLLILGTLVVVLSVLVYVNLYLYRSKASETAPDYTILGNQITINVKEDAFVNSNYPNNNSGTEGSLKVKANPTKITYLKFDLTAHAGRIVTSAKLKIYVSDPSNGIISIGKVFDNSWTEKSITFNNQPGVATTGPRIATFTPTSSGKYLEIDITGYVRNSLGNLMSLGILTTSTNELEFKSRNVSDPAKRPVLIMQTSNTEVDTPPKIITSRVEGLQDAPAGSPYPYIVPYDEAIDVFVDGYDPLDDVSAAVDLTWPDGRVENTYVNIALPEDYISPELCKQVRCFNVWIDNFGIFPDYPPGHYVITIRVADSKGNQAPPIKYDFMLATDPLTTPSPSPTPGICTSGSECLSYQTCDLATRRCKNLSCPVPPQCKNYRTENHSCLLENSPGTNCVSSGILGSCENGICVIPKPSPFTPTATPTPAFGSCVFTTPMPTTAQGCTSDSQCPYDQRCDLTTRICIEVSCPPPPVCRGLQICNHQCQLSNIADGSFCVDINNNFGTCQNGICLMTTPVPG